MQFLKMHQHTKLRNYIVNVTLPSIIGVVVLFILLMLADLL